MHVWYEIIHHLPEEKSEDSLGFGFRVQPSSKWNGGWKTVDERRVSGGGSAAAMVTGGHEMVRGGWWVVLQRAFRVLPRPNGNAILGGWKTVDVRRVSVGGKAAGWSPVGSDSKAIAGLRNGQETPVCEMGTGWGMCNGYQIQISK
ncbi:hypothetical protein V8G54_028036 [Vigna mungo]|uniref:Uncharacterized protein n=1 Tax=Vigna mungo TaxID=3915 RepID=A0AAQ3MRM1_VIGMU